MCVYLRTKYPGSRYSKSVVELEENLLQQFINTCEDKKGSQKNTNLFHANQSPTFGNDLMSVDINVVNKICRITPCSNQSQRAVMTGYEDLVTEKDIHDIGVNVESQNGLLYFYSAQSPNNVVIPVSEPGLTPQRYFASYV